MSVTPSLWEGWDGPQLATMSEPIIIKTVICIDYLPILRTSPTNAKVVIEDVKRVAVSKEYEVRAIIKRYDNQYYQFVNFPDNNLFDVRGFVEKKTNDNAR